MHLFPPSTPFWPSTLIHSFHMTKPSQYSLIRSLLTNYHSIPALIRTCSFINQPIRDTPTKLLKHFNSKTFTFLLSALLIAEASALYNSVGTIDTSRIDTSWPLNLQSSIAQHDFQHSPRSIPLIHYVYHIPFTSFIICHLKSYRYIKQSTSSNGSPFSITCIRPPFPYLDHLITYSYLHSFSTFFKGTEKQ